MYIVNMLNDATVTGTALEKHDKNLERLRHLTMPPVGIHVELIVYSTWRQSQNRVTTLDVLGQCFVGSVWVFQ